MRGLVRDSRERGLVRQVPVGQLPWMRRMRATFTSSTKLVTSALSSSTVSASAALASSSSSISASSIAKPNPKHVAADPKSIPS